MTARRRPQFRAVLYCAACQVVVATGPDERSAALAAYRLGVVERGDAVERHLATTCKSGSGLSESIFCTVGEAPAQETTVPRLGQGGSQ